MRHSRDLLVQSGREAIAFGTQARKNMMFSAILRHARILYYAKNNQKAQIF